MLTYCKLEYQTYKSSDLHVWLSMPSPPTGMLKGNLSHYLTKMVITTTYLFEYQPVGQPYHDPNRLGKWLRNESLEQVPSL